MHEQTSQETVTSLHDLSAVDLIAGFRARQFSPSEVLEDVLAHVAVWEPHIKALYAFDPEGARATAKASTERWQNGQPIGVLDGVLDANHGDFDEVGRRSLKRCVHRGALGETALVGVLAVDVGNRANASK